MIRFQPASIPWLLAHELRLTWRGFVSGRKSRGPVSMIALAVLVVMALIAGVSIALAVHGRQIPIVPLSIAIGDFVLAVILTLMLSTGLAAAADVLYERGDLDLLFSSPIAPRKVLFVRALGVAVNAATWFVIPALLLVGPSIIYGHPGWAGLFGVLAAASLAAPGLASCWPWPCSRLSARGARAPWPRCWRP